MKVEAHVGVMMSLCEARYISLEWPRDRRKSRRPRDCSICQMPRRFTSLASPMSGLRLGTEFMPHNRRMVMKESRKGYPGPTRLEPLAAWKTIRLLLVCILLAAIAALLAAGIGTMPHWLLGR